MEKPKNSRFHLVTFSQRRPACERLGAFPFLKRAQFYFFPSSIPRETIIWPPLSDPDFLKKMELIVSAACVSIAGILGSHSLAAHMIAQHGTEDQKAKHLPALATGERRTELATGEREPVGELTPGDEPPTNQPPGRRHDRPGQGARRKRPGVDGGRGGWHPPIPGGQVSRSG